MNFLGVFGHVVLDYIFRVPKLPEPNTSIQIVERKQYFGGTAGNIARTAARLGVKTAIASFVGEDFPEDYRRAFEEDGIDIADLRVLPGHTTPTAWIFSDPEGNQVAIIDQGPMKEGSHLEVLEHTVNASDLIHIGTGRPEYYRSVVNLAREKGKEIAFDPSQEIHYVYSPGTFRELLKCSDIFFGNRHEFQRALAYTGVKEPPDLLQFSRVAVLTLGTEGSVIYTRRGGWRIPCIPAESEVDVTGAGDAYRAGFYAGLSRGLEPAQCGLVGASAASFCVEGQGPQTRLPSWDDAWERASRYEEGIRDVPKQKSA
ncbi:MAG: carbohydrate kinase family protein [Thermoplasmata archaeon]